MLSRLEQFKVAVLIPCYNEERTISQVVRDFKKELPHADIYVYDNNSKDRTIEVARSAGAIIGRVTAQGKGNVVRRMFADVHADVYVLVDGDDTYTADGIRDHITRLLEERLDMINISRESDEKSSYRPGHRFGNIFLTQLVSWFFGKNLTDMLSGYRVFSRRFVKSFPILSNGFELETELAIHAIQIRMPIAEISARYKSRPAGSESKLRTFHDGFRILLLIAKLIKEERPMAFFGSLFLLQILFAVGLIIPVVREFLDTGLVPRFPTAILSTGLTISGLLSLVCGLVLDTVTRSRQELKILHYLNIESRFIGDKE